MSINKLSAVPVKQTVTGTELVPVQEATGATWLSATIQVIATYVNTVITAAGNVWTAAQTFSETIIFSKSITVGIDAAVGGKVTATGNIESGDTVKGTDGEFTNQPTITNYNPGSLNPAALASNYALQRLIDTTNSNGLVWYNPVTSKLETAVHGAIDNNGVLSGTASVQDQTGVMVGKGYLTIYDAGIPADSGDLSSVIDGSVAVDDDYIYWKTSAGWIRALGQTF